MYFAMLSLAVLLLGYGVVILRSQRRYARIMHARRADSMTTFAKEFDGSPWSRAALEIAYADLVKLTKIPVRRSDDLEQTLGLVPEDFERMLEHRCQQLGIADIWNSQHVALFPLKTVEDYVRFLSTVMGDKERSVLPPLP